MSRYQRKNVGTEGVRGQRNPALPGRRKHPRYPVRRLVSCHYEGEHLLSLTLDLGLGGMKIETHDHIPKDKRLDIKLFLIDRAIPLRGRVAYSGMLSGEQRVLGIQFVDFSERSWAALRDHLRSLEA